MWILKKKNQILLTLATVKKNILVCDFLTEYIFQLEYLYFYRMHNSH